MCGDGSLGTKMTVQFNLFGGSVLKLGTARHHGDFLKRMDMVDDIGCFALTELGCAVPAPALDVPLQVLV
jgi:acyl-CoA oxidase